MNVTAHAFGHRVQIGFPEGGAHIERAMRREGWYEKRMLIDSRRRLAQRPGRILDVGAFVGTHTLWWAAVCGRRVLAFEPAAEAFAALEENVRQNRRSEYVQLRNVAVGAEPGRGRYVAGDSLENAGASRVVRDEEGPIPIVTIDSYKLSDVALIKIDVEGSELEVLRGARETIIRCRPLLYVEAPTTLEEVGAFLEPLGYTRFGTFNATPTYGFAPTREITGPVQAVTLSLAVMAHPKRERHIPYLLERLGEDVPVVWDQRNDRWDTGHRSIAAYDPSATHHLVVQDDAILCRDFREGAALAISHVAPGHPVGFYIGAPRHGGHLAGVASRVRSARQRGKHFLRMGGPWWGVAVAIPTEHIAALLEHGDANVKIPNYDMRMTLYFRSRKIDCFYTIPNLVNHRVGPDEPSLVPGRSSGPTRVAVDFLGEDRSALEVPWGSA